MRGVFRGPNVPSQALARLSSTPSPFSGPMAARPNGRPLYSIVERGRLMSGYAFER
jgi:hypothetical protein